MRQVISPKSSPGPELRDRFVHGQIDVRVDPDELALVRLRALVVAVVDEKTFHPRDASAEESPAGLRAQMGQRIVDGNVDRARDDVVGGRAELAFGADRFAFAIAMEDGRAFRPVVELPARDFLQRRQILDQLIDAERLPEVSFPTGSSIALPGMILNAPFRVEAF